MVPVFDARSLAKGALVAASVLAVAEAARGTAASGLEYEMLVFPKGCLAKFTAGDLLNEFCLKKTISKCLGYGIIAGACARGGVPCCLGRGGHVAKI